MHWTTILARLTDSVDQHLLDRNAYLLAENRLLRSRLHHPLRFTGPERIALAKAAKPLGRTALREIATVVTPTPSTVSSPESSWSRSSSSVGTKSASVDEARPRLFA